MACGPLQLVWSWEDNLTFLLYGKCVGYATHVQHLDDSDSLDFPHLCFLAL